MRPTVSAVLGCLLSAGLLVPTVAADEIKAVEVEVKNSSAQDIFVYIDTIGRAGKEEVPGPDGKPLPKGLVIKARSNKTFGEAVGLGDAPTLHLWIVQGGKTVGKERANKKVGPLPGDILEKIKKADLRPRFTLEWDGKELKEVK